MLATSVFDKGMRELELLDALRLQGAGNCG